MVKKGLLSLDVVLSLAILAAMGVLVHRITVGLDYSWNWGAIPQYLFRYDARAGAWVPNLLVQGLLNTIRLSLWGILLASLLGTIVGLCRVSRSLFGRLLGRLYVELVRNLPPLVLVFIFYFFVSEQVLPTSAMENFIRSLSGDLQRFLTLLFAPPSLLSPFLSGLIALAVFEGAYIAEIVRAGIESVEKGQWEASSALGLTRVQQMRHVILPQAVRRILPPLAGQFISTVKDSAIVSVISIQELTFQGLDLMSSTYLTYEIWITVTFLYLTLTLSLSLAVSGVEVRLRRVQT
ncbi:MAG: amino acid ABC transporter permease [Deltaproteobacteria bacterium]|nr:amino acid ABC transporter permease [Deltaproteobacteria bacterium]